MSEKKLTINVEDTRIPPALGGHRYVLVYVPERHEVYTDLQQQNSITVLAHQGQAVEMAPVPQTTEDRLRECLQKRTYAFEMLRSQYLGAEWDGQNMRGEWLADAAEVIDVAVERIVDAMRELPEYVDDVANFLFPDTAAVVETLRQGFAAQKTLRQIAEDTVVACAVDALLDIDEVERALVKFLDECDAEAEELGKENGEVGDPLDPMALCSAVSMVPDFNGPLYHRFAQKWREGYESVVGA